MKTINLKAHFDGEKILLGWVKRSEPIIKLFTPLRHKGTKKNLVYPLPIPLRRGTQGEVATLFYGHA
ncbi:MAG: hypothetical protein Q6358_15450 [Candidatus Brocadiales bacterium]|nr:hypothetical protein [Candidatus Brocadiales bacterium]